MAYYLKSFCKLKCTLNGFSCYVLDLAIIQDSNSIILLSIFVTETHYFGPFMILTCTHCRSLEVSWDGMVAGPYPTCCCQSSLNMLVIVATIQLAPQFSSGSKGSVLPFFLFSDPLSDLKYNLIIRLLLNCILVDLHCISGEVLSTYEHVLMCISPLSKQLLNPYKLWVNL